MTFWLILVVVFVSGGIGGIANALMSDNGFILPKKIHTQGGGGVWRPGFLGNVLIGGIAAVISWGLYGPFAAYPLLGGAAPAGAGPVSLTLSALVGAVLVGVGGARWLSNEVDKTLLRVAASQAAAAGPDSDKANRILTATPAGAVELTS